MVPNDIPGYQNLIHSHGWLHAHSLMLPCGLEHNRSLLGLAALVKCRMGTHQMRIIGVNMNSSTACLETLHKGVLFKAQTSFQPCEPKECREQKE